jgi:hypothetical protein
MFACACALYRINNTSSFAQHCTHRPKLCHSFLIQAADVLREARALYTALRVPDADVRGLGITVRSISVRPHLFK